MLLYTSCWALALSHRRLACVAYIYSLARIWGACPWVVFLGGQSRLRGCSAGKRTTDNVAQILTCISIGGWWVCSSGFCTWRRRMQCGWITPWPLKNICFTFLVFMFDLVSQVYANLLLYVSRIKCARVLKRVSHVDFTMQMVPSMLLTA